MSSNQKVYISIVLRSVRIQLQAPNIKMPDEAKDILEQNRPRQNGRL